MSNIVLYTDTLSELGLDTNRAWIAIKAEALMARYYQIQVDPIIKLDIIKGWMDSLQYYSPQEIEDAIRTHINDSPKIRPHEGMIRKIIIDVKKKSYRPPPPVKTLPKDIPSLQRRRELVAELTKGFTKSKKI